MKSRTPISRLMTHMFQVENEWKREKRIGLVVHSHAAVGQTLSYFAKNQGVSHVH